MGLTQDKIQHLRKLTALSGENTEDIDIDSVIGSFGELQKLDIPKSLEIQRSGQGSLILREDRVEQCSIHSDELLKVSGQKIVGHQIALSSIMQGE